MSLLQNEDFAIYQLRTSYLANIHDGVGERLININTTFLNDPAFRAAGWSANPPEIKRTYSPPIPTAVTAEYFQAPPQSTGLAGSGLDDEDEGGMVTGAGGLDSLGPDLQAKTRKRREQFEEDDSSDLSEESDEEVDAAQRPANQIRFAKMPERRDRAGSSPVRSSSRTKDGPSVLVTSPSRPPENQRLRRGSLGAVEAIKARERRDTTTSSEVSSENDLDPSVFKRRQVLASSAAKAGGTWADRIREDQQQPPDAAVDAEEIDETAYGSDDSSLASGFSETVDSHSILDGAVAGLRSPGMSSIPADRPSPFRGEPLKRSKEAPETLAELPPPRPISTMQTVSALAAAIKAKNKKPASPLDRFAALSGKGEPNPLYIKIYFPESSSAASEPLELHLRKVSTEGRPVTVGEAIGFSLWRYCEDGLQPPIPSSKMNVNWWTFRIVEDGDVDYDFPPLGRIRPMSDFTSNNNRPQRIRARDKPWDEFALVEASDVQFKENENATPEFSHQAADVQDESVAEKPERPERPEPVRQQSDPDFARPRRNIVTDPIFMAAAMRKDTASSALDAPVAPVSHAIPRSGPPKTLNIHYTDSEYMPRATSLEVTTDTYIAEVFDQVCRKLNVDKALYVLKVSRTTTVAPSDRTVEALGHNRQSLDLIRRRFVGDGTFGLSGSPGSSSPNAPLLLTTTGTPKKAKKGMTAFPPPQQSEMLGLTLGSLNTSYKRYNVVRKQPMSFTPSQPRILVLDAEYMHIMPPEAGKEKSFDAVQGKVTSIPFSSIVGCKVNRKHPKTLRVVVFKERESKRYDFEANTASEAAEIMLEIKKGIEPYQDAIAL